MNKISEDILSDFRENLEKLNFLSWYRGATAEDFEMAQKNNSAKLAQLLEKYESEIAIIDIETSKVFLHRCILPGISHG